jgi:DNA-binding response OmpR family regulator
MSAGVSVGAVRATNRTLDLIIMDMGRPPDPQAGYTLVNKLHEPGDAPPVIIYSVGGRDQDNQTLARQRGAFGSTSGASELLALVEAILKR